MKYKLNPNTKCTCSNPGHHAFWILNIKGILRSLDNIFKKQDIGRLTKDAYDFVYNMSGFIAHCNHGGFMDYYRDLRTFADDLLRSADTKDADRYITDSYFSEGEQSAYYAQKTDILKQIPAIVKKYQPEIEKSFYKKEKDEALTLAHSLISKYQTI